ncbi:MAG: Spx/MgsR family RNA polymerase-binding regulatory protein [Dokdonella sp.]
MSVADQNIRVYGLKNCDTCRKARNWLERQQIDHEFVDYREHPIAAALLKGWAAQVGGFEKLVNRSGMTWRNLLPALKSPRSDAEWLLLIKEYPALVRRPILVIAEQPVQIGFTDKRYASLFADE